MAALPFRSWSTHGPAVSLFRLAARPRPSSRDGAASCDCVSVRTRITRSRNMDCNLCWNNNRLQYVQTRRYIPARLPAAGQGEISRHCGGRNTLARGAKECGASCPGTTFFSRVGIAKRCRAQDARRSMTAGNPRHARIRAIMIARCREHNNHNHMIGNAPAAAHCAKLISCADATPTP